MSATKAPACIACHHFDLIHSEDPTDEVSIGYCRRHAPAPFTARHRFDNPDVFWPIVDRGQWCGEYEDIA